MFLLVLAGFVPCGASSVASQAPQVIFIEFHLVKSVGDYLPIIVRQGKDGPVAQLRLQPQPSHPNVYEGSFSIEFRTGAAIPLRELEFSDPQGNELYAAVHQTRFQRRYRLFGNANLRDRFKATLPPDEAPVARGAAPGKPVTAEAKPVVAPAKPQVVDLKALEEERKRQEEARRLEERRQEEERLQTELREVQRREQLRLEQERMSAAQRAKRKAEAKVLGESALAAYRANDNEKAARDFSKAAELDPDNDSYYFQYAVTMYRLEDYNRSLALFSLADGPGVDSVEKEYYIALNHMRLREFDKALKGFQEVQAEKESELSPVAAYFAGTLLFQSEKYPEARQSFEYVLDHSKDPKMDNEAERMIEEINRIENYLASAKEIFRVGLNMGLIYDTNIMNMSTENLATDVAGFRANYGASLTGHLVRTRKHNLSLQLGVSDLYSVNSKFKGDATLQATDALQMSATLPYQWDFEIGERSNTFMLTPTYKTLALAIEEGKRSTIMTSTGASLSWSLVVSGSWISQVSMESAADAFSLEVTDPNNDQSATRLMLSTTQTRLLHPSGNELVSFDLGTTSNAARGINQRYRNVALGVTYLRPGPWKSPVSFRVDYTNQVYPESLENRKDTLMNLSVSHIKSFNPRWTLVSTVMGTNSQSTQDSSTYNKFMASAALSYSLGISRD